MGTVYLFPQTVESEALLLERYGETFTPKSDSGVDIPLDKEFVIPADGEPHQLNHHCIVKVIKDGKKSAFWMAPRSSCSKKNERALFLTNGLGLFDKEYTGPVIAQFINLRKSSTKIEAGSRLVQIALPTLETPDKVVVVKRTDSETWDRLLKSDDPRSSGGFGSTGK